MNLSETLEKHSEWLRTNGEEGERADLREADLRGVNLQGADLRGADLQGANDAPLSVQVGPWPVLIHGGYMRIGRQRHPIDHWRNFSDAEIASMALHAPEFWKANREWLLGACEAQQATIRED